MKAIFGLPFLLLIAAQQVSSPSTMPDLPPCAVPCLTTAIENSTCVPLNQTCLCLDISLQTSAAACVESACSVAEALTTKNITQTACGFPVRDRSKSWFALGLSLELIAIAAVCLRILSRYLGEQPFGLDDCFVAATITISLPATAMNYWGGLTNGLGKDFWTLTPAQITGFFRTFTILEVLYVVQVSLLKFAILFFYWRVFKKGQTARLLRYTAWFNGIFGFVCAVFSTIQCWPISYAWHNWEGVNQGKCINAGALAWSNAAINIALDIWMLSLPMWELYHSQMVWKKRIQAGSMFLVGTFVTVVSALRLRSLVYFSRTVNPTWDDLPVVQWSTVEVCICVVYACMPNFRVLLDHAIHRRFNISKTSDNSNQQLDNARRQIGINMPVTPVHHSRNLYRLNPRHDSILSDDVSHLELRRIRGLSTD